MLLSLEGNMIIDRITNISIRNPQKIAIKTTSGKKISYISLLNNIKDYSVKLIESNPKNKLVCIKLNNSIEYISLILSIFDLNWCYFPLLSNLSEKYELHLLDKLKPGLMIVNDIHDKSKYSKFGIKVLTLDEYLKIVSCRDIKLEDNQILDSEVSYLGINRIMWSSGTSGEPKPIAWKQEKLFQERERWNKATLVNENEIFYCRHPLEVAHATDMHLYASLQASATLILDDCNLDDFSTLQFIKTEAVTVLSWLPNHYLSIVNNDFNDTIDLSLPNLKLAMCGGSVIPPNLSEHFYDLTGVKIQAIYGSTEFGLSMLQKDKQSFSHSLSLVDNVEIANEINKQSRLIKNLTLRSSCMFEGYLDIDRYPMTCSHFNKKLFNTGDAVRISNDGIEIIAKTNDIIFDEDNYISCFNLGSKIDSYFNFNSESVIYSERLKNTHWKFNCFINLPVKKLIFKNALYQILRSFDINIVIESINICIINKIPRTPVGKVDKTLLMENLNSSK